MPIYSYEHNAIKGLGGRASKSDAVGEVGQPTHHSQLLSA